ncbi:hypothetical protein [Chloroflexus sp.]|uniref:hypothetical protein n=1 Tax=Chloroflexus sp. TaxID=1904827 RepID=UPI002ACD7757|nr:hypothetical protein [Chloroflexus sp.]
MAGTPELISKDTLRYLELLQTELAVFYGYRQLWAEGAANGRRLPLSLDELLREQQRQVQHIAYLALAAQQTVYPGQSSHARFVYREKGDEGDE